MLRLKGSHVARAAYEKNCGQVVVLFLMPSQPVRLYQGHCGQVDNQKLRKINTDHYTGSASFSSCFVLLMLCTSKKKKKDPFITKRLEVVQVVLKLYAKNIYVHNPTNKHRYIPTFTTLTHAQPHTHKAVGPPTTVN